MTRHYQDAFVIIENKAKVRTSRNKMQTSSVNKNDEVMSAIAMLTKKVESLAKEKPSNQVNVVNHGCETCGGPHPYYECPATGAFPHENVYAANTGGSGYPSQGDRNLLSYRSTNYLGPPGFSNQNQNQVPNFKTVTTISTKIKIELIMEDFKIKVFRIKVTIIKTGDFKIKAIFIIKTTFTIITKVKEVSIMEIMGIKTMKIFKAKIKVLIKIIEGQILIKIKMLCLIRHRPMKS